VPSSLPAPSPSSSVTITSASGPAASSGRRLLHRELQAMEGAVIVYAEINTTQQDAPGVIKLLESSVASGDFTTALRDAGTCHS
jgi:hypothetical protein